MTTEKKMKTIMPPHTR